MLQLEEVRLAEEALAECNNNRTAAEKRAAEKRRLSRRQSRNEAKRHALLEEIEKVCGAEIYLIGIGNGVADFIKVAAKKGHRTRVAHVPKGATAAQITGVLRATVNAPARDLATDATIIQIDAPEAVAMQPTAEQTKAIEITAADVVVGASRVCRARS